MFSVCLYATYVVYAVAHALCISPSVFETRLPYIDTSFRIWIPLAQIWYVTSGVRATQTDNRVGMCTFNLRKPIRVRSAMIRVVLV